MRRAAQRLVLCLRPGVGFGLRLSLGLGLAVPVVGGLEAAGQGLPAASGTAVAEPGQGVAAITLQQAIERARANEPTFAAAVAQSKVASLDRSIARAALLPGAVYHNQFLYTQPNGARNQAGSVGNQASPKFIANNGVREYASQAVVTETFGLQQYTAFSRATAEAAVARAELEVASRGLVATVVGLFYGVAAAEAKLTVASRAAAEAAGFTKQTTEREAAREVAHADVIKAQLSEQQRQRELADATLAVGRARLDLGVLLFADPRTPYRVAVGDGAPVLGTRAEVEAAAGRQNPELQSAVASLRASSLGVTAARAAYLPDLALNYSYGIDAEQFAVNGPQGVRNLGYSASATLDIPVWDWLATRDRVKQSVIQRDTARVVLTATQRRLVADLEENYAEAVVARDQVASLAESVKTAAESLRLTRLRYTAGEATVLEVVDAQNSLTLAETAQTDGDTRFRTALAQIQLLTGTM